MTESVRKTPLALRIIRILMLVLTVLLIVCIVCVNYVFPVYKVTGDSMQPEMTDNELLLTYRTADYRRGDIVVIEKDRKTFIRRIIGLGGDIITWDSETWLMRVNGEPLKDAIPDPPEGRVNSVSYPYRVPSDSVFVIGDNSTNAIDSRTLAFGSIPESSLQAVVMSRIYPLTKLTWYGIHSVPKLGGN